MPQTKNIKRKPLPRIPTTVPAGTRPGFLRRRAKPLLLIALAAVLVAVGASALVPETARYSFENVIGKNRGAPFLDTLSGQYSVAGEAASTSLLVKYKSSVPESTKANINAQAGAKSKRNISRLGVDIVQVASTQSVSEILGKYRARAEVDYVEPNYMAKRFLTPDDALYAKQWHLQKIEAPKAWDVSQGGFGPIAIIDTGIAASQADLNGSVQTGYNFVNDTTDTSDDNGHGTHVAGIVSAATNNATGVASIGFKGSLLPVKVLDAAGAGTYGDVASGIVYAADQGAKIVNLSLGGSSASRTLEDAVKYALARGVVVVAAAGNNSNDSLVYPAAYPGVIAVTATAQDDTLASFSSYGNHVYISAPGVGIVSTYNSGGYATMSGTSMATPVVAGLIGLALSRGTTTATTVLSDLKSTSDKVGPYAYDTNGWNQYFGFGRINAARLLAVPTATEPTTTSGDTSTTETTTTRGNSGQSQKRGPKSADTGLQFNVTVEGTVDSIDTARSVVIVKVKSSSNSLQLSSSNLVDLFVTGDSSIRSGGSLVPFTSLKAGDSLNIKALWKDNQLTAQEIIVLGGGGSQGNQPGQPAERSRRP